MPQPPFDLIVFGATGFTGRLVAEYLFKTYGVGGPVAWALAGRNLDKLAAVRREIGAPDALPLRQADAANPAALAALVAQARVVLSTVGPYQLHGEPLLRACADAGTDYVDLCGEPLWMARMIARHEDAARASGARVVFSCGFDSIPFDLGVLMLQREAQARFGRPAQRVAGRVRRMKGRFSGGTAASLKATLAAAKSEPGVYDLLRSPFALTPGFEGPKQPSGHKPMLDELLGVWVAPFVMAAINTRNVHRSNFLLGHAYGADFVYDEMVVAGHGDKGEATARAMAADDSLAADDGPKPGDGPSKQERDSGFYDLLFVGRTTAGETLRVAVSGDRDPGYGSTSKMIGEAAVCLQRDAADTPGGIWTPAAAMGTRLITRLQQHAGLKFDVEPT